MSSLTFDLLLQAKRELEAACPRRDMLAHLYCVDMPALVAELREMCRFGRNPIPTSLELAPLHGMLYGVPFTEIRTATLTLSDRLRLPMLCQIPGVWAVMQDGQVARIWPGAVSAGRSDASDTSDRSYGSGASHE